VAVGVRPALEMMTSRLGQTDQADIQETQVDEEMKQEQQSESTPNSSTN